MKKDIELHLKNLKKSHQKLACLTAYDYPSARLLDEAGIDLILVGDSLGMVVLGHPDTTQVTLADIVHHLKAVRRGVSKSILVADLPAGSEKSIDHAVDSSLKLQASGAEMVKLEGPHPEHIRAIIASGVPLVGHIGMLCQQVIVEGGYSIKGKTEEDAKRLIQEAHLIEEAGASAIVLELIKPSVVKTITEELSIPTIGIGSGDNCDGQILVLTDLLGLQPWFCPAHVKKTYNLASILTQATKEYIYDVKVNE